MINEEEARAKILERVKALGPRMIALESARNCFAAEESFARLAMPLFDNSAMDGYAVIAQNCRPGSRLRVVGEQAAGVDWNLRVSDGKAVRIFTGAPMPRGADAVVMQEDVAREGPEIIINTEVESGEFVRSRGCDLSEGQRILEAGEQLKPENIALLAAQGFSEINVGGKVRAAIISTGDEVVAPGEELRAGEIYESNSILLRGLLETVGVKVASVRHARDEWDDLWSVIETGIAEHALIISGGVSVGERDLVRGILSHLGAEIDLWRVAIKPGKPFLFGRVRDCAVFGLPGNPVSTFVTFLLLVRPALLKMMGANDQSLRLPMFMARLGADLQNNSDRRHYIRGELRETEFRPVGRQESHALYSLSRANALLALNPGEAFSAGAIVRVQTWS